jgi:glycosyltransferase involved in cell wall biosynthesis
MKTILHVLMNKNGLQTYPSVYNALYCWSKLGWSNHIIAGGPTEEFNDLIEKEYRFSGGYAKRGLQLASIPGDYDIAIVYDPPDLEAFYATRWLLPRNSYRRLIHHCLEIPTASSKGRSLVTHGLHKILAGGYRLIDHLIVQDQLRADLFFYTLPYLKGLPYHLVSNSFISAIEPIETSLNWFDEFRARSRFLIVYAGMIESWAVSESLVRRLTEIPEATFLFSGWSRDGYAEALADRYRTASNVRFHLGIKDRATFNYMVANCDAGLVWYESQDHNVSHVGLSSGKMHKFLSYNKPVISNHYPSLQDFIASHGFGVSVTTDDIRIAIREVTENYSMITKNIRARYSALCNYEREYIAFAREFTSEFEGPPADACAVQGQTCAYQPAAH